MPGRLPSCRVHQALRPAFFIQYSYRATPNSNPPKPRLGNGSKVFRHNDIAHYLGRYGQDFAISLAQTGVCIPSFLTINHDTTCAFSKVLVCFFHETDRRFLISEDAFESSCLQSLFIFSRKKKGLGSPFILLSYKKGKKMETEMVVCISMGKAGGQPLRICQWRKKRRREAVLTRAKGKDTSTLFVGDPVFGGASLMDPQERELMKPTSPPYDSYEGKPLQKN